MASQVTANLNANLTATLLSALGLGNATFPLSLQPLLNLALANGTGANKVNQLWSDQRTLASTANESINIYAPVTNDAVGNALTIATVKALIIQNLAAVEADSLSIGGGGTTAAWTSFLADNTDIVKIPGGGSLIVVAPGATGYVVGASTTNHTLKVLNNSASNAVQYNIVIIGATA